MAAPGGSSSPPWRGNGDHPQQVDGAAGVHAGPSPAGRGRSRTWAAGPRLQSVRVGREFVSQFDAERGDHPRQVDGAAAVHAGPRPAGRGRSRTWTAGPRLQGVRVGREFVSQRDAERGDHPQQVDGAAGVHGGPSPAGKGRSGTWTAGPRLCSVRAGRGFVSRRARGRGHPHHRDGAAGRPRRTEPHRQGSVWDVGGGSPSNGERRMTACRGLLV